MLNYKEITPFGRFFKPIIHRNKMEYEQKYHEKIHNYLINDDKYYKLRAKVAFKRFFSWIKDIKSKKILEFGSGLGQNIFQIKNNAVGYDISKTAKDFARKKGIKHPSSEKQIKDNSFDIILSCHNLEHMESPVENLKFLHKKLNKNGRLILVIPRDKNSKRESLEPELINYHLYSWNFETINNLLHKSGFKVLKNKYYWGTAYKKLSWLNKISFSLYLSAVSVAGWIKGHGDLFIIAKKGK